MLTSKQRRPQYAPLLGAATIMAILGASCLSAQTPAVTDNASGLRLLVDPKSTLPALRLVLPGQPMSKGILMIFPEHVTVREHGQSKLDSFTWPVPPPEKRVVKDEGITYYNASLPVDEPFIATISEDGEWIAATWNPDTGNVWTNPELTCQHADSETSLKAGGTASLEVKTFVFKGTLKHLLVKIRHGPGP